MPFFAARKPLKGVVKQSSNNGAVAAAAASSSTSATQPGGSTAPTATGSNAGNVNNNNSNNAPKPATAVTTKLVSVTRKVIGNGAPQTLRERQALTKAKRARESEKEMRLQEEQRRRDAEERSAKAREDAAAKRRKLDKGKGREESNTIRRANDSSSADEGVADGRLNPDARVNANGKATRSKLTIESSDEGESSSRLGTPIFERKQPLRVPRNNVAAEKDDLQTVQVLSADEVVRNARSDFVPFFPDLPLDARIELEYPGDNATESFLLVRPKVKDGQDYHPIQDIISAVRVILDNFLTPEQASEHFKHVQHQTASSLGAASFDFLTLPSPSASRSGTPMSDQANGTPEPGATHTSASTPTAQAQTVSATASPAPLASIISKQPLLRQLEKASRRQLGKEFVATLEYYNGVMQHLKAIGAIRETIASMGKEYGIPEAVWMKVTGQCYERTVGPRVEELKKYEAFSDSVYGELMPPFVAHIANLTNLKTDSVMVDMGSGVGNCAVQASLATGCKSYGFEFQPGAASIAAAQTKELFARARLWGLQSGPCETHECDFLASPGLTGPALQDADVVLINNYVFSSQTCAALSLMFLDLKEGTRIVSLKPFVHSNSGAAEITDRNAYSPESILVQSKPIVYSRGSVSWSDEPGKFYIATVNRDRLKKFLASRGM